MTSFCRVANRFFLRWVWTWTSQTSPVMSSLPVASVRPPGDDGRGDEPAMLCKAGHPRPQNVSTQCGDATAGCEIQKHEPLLSSYREHRSEIRFVCQAETVHVL